jgi:hypothetical protein
LKSKTRNNGEWTEARFTSFIKSALRSASQRWPPKYQTLNEAFVGKQINASSGRLAKHFKCRKCANLFPQKEVEVNHITPVVPLTGFDSWDGVIERMFCEKHELEVLCKPCHSEISKKENSERKINKS